jgi:phosphocarrier protein HPr
MTLEDADVHRTIIIRNKRGLHARASAKFVTIAGNFDALVKVTKDGSTVCGTSIMGLMMLAAAIGDKIFLQSSGQEKHELMDALESLIHDKFGEECEE